MITRITLYFRLDFKVQDIQNVKLEHRSDYFFFVSFHWQVDFAYYLLTTSCNISDCDWNRIFYRPPHVQCLASANCCHKREPETIITVGVTRVSRRWKTLQARGSIWPDKLQCRTQGERCVVSTKLKLNRVSRQTMRSWTGRCTVSTFHVFKWNLMNWTKQGQ